MHPGVDCPLRTGEWAGALPVHCTGLEERLNTDLKSTCGLSLIMAPAPVELELRGRPSSWEPPNLSLVPCQDLEASLDNCIH